MNQISDIKKWLEELNRFGRISESIEVLEDTDTSFRFRIYTTTHRYNISANSNTPKGYLGCIVSNRTPYAGEEHTRGNDLLDGELTYETWVGIISDIISYEMVKIYKRKQPMYDIPVNNN